MTKSERTAWPGEPFPLGATLAPDGVNFALFSAHARGVDLCLFDTLDGPETARVPLVECTEQVWHCFLPGVRAGQLYGYRVHGSYRPAQGARFNAHKLLLDPYARAVASPTPWHDSLLGYAPSDAADRDLKRDLRDNARVAPKSVVVDGAFDWGGDRLLRTPMADSVIYEVHVKGFSKLARHLPEELRGSYAALGSPWAVEYFQKLGVTAVELLPVQQFFDEPFLSIKGSSNYWGYNSIGYLAPHAAYAHTGTRGEQVTEFKQMVKNLHAGGIEVILDVVYNHTAEGNHHGPTLCFRGIDNASYYRLMPDEPRLYRDYTGCGNTLDTQHPRVLQLIMDSLRYWVTEMHVDGFRFDLASTLAREVHAVDNGSGFFDILQQDPVLSRVKLIAEPWDVGEGGYQVGNFPVIWAEWNGKYRDCVRSYWRGDAGQIGEFASRLTGSSDLYLSGGRKPHASVNFIIAHDGFTLGDLVSYNEKHNEANGEENRDGESHNRSWNGGVEGPTDDPEILAIRRRQMRNLLATLLFSQGVPMLCGGDEFGRSQRGNNNTYCQDNELNWLTWDRDAPQRELEDFTRQVIALRRRHPVFRRTKFFQDREHRGAQSKNILWLSDTGREMDHSHWTSPHLRALGVVLDGQTTEVRDARGEPVLDETFMLLFNAHHGPVTFLLAGLEDVRWALLLDTREERGFLETPRAFSAGEECELAARSTCLLRLTAGTGAQARHASWRPRE